MAGSPPDSEARSPAAAASLGPCAPHGASPCCTSRAAWPKDYRAGAITTSGTYYTNFSAIDESDWQYNMSCFDCSAKNPDECTKNFKSAVHPASIADAAGLTITTTRRSNLTWCSPTPGGTSGYIKFKRALSFGTIRVKAKYFPGASSTVKSAKGFIGLEDSSSGAITITIHGKGAKPSGAPANADWTRWMQSSCYQHGDDHKKEFSELGSSVNAADDFNWYEITWSSTSVIIKVNGVVARTVTGASSVPQKPLYVRLHSRSIAYSDMPADSTFSSFIDEFHYEPLSR